VPPANERSEETAIMKNPLDSISGTIWSGVIITIVLWIIVGVLWF
jgi:hypothetical protein